MAALTESTAVDSSSSEVNHKEAYSDSVPSQADVKSSPSKCETDANEENSCVSRKPEEVEEASHSEACDSKKKFIEAPIPKINPWTVKRQAPPAGTLRGSAPKNLQIGKLCYSFFFKYPFKFFFQPYPNNGDVNTGGYSHLWFCSPSYHLYNLSVSVLLMCNMFA